MASMSFHSDLLVFFGGGGDGGCSGSSSGETGFLSGDVNTMLEKMIEVTSRLREPACTCLMELGKRFSEYFP